MLPEETKTQRKDRILTGLRHLGGKKEKRSYSHHEIADVCGTSPSEIYKLEQQALKKLQEAFSDDIS